MDHQLMSDIEVASGKLHGGAAFRLIVSEQVDVDDLRNIGNLLHLAATKLESEQRDAASAHESPK
jgi:hypothetical protein